MSLGTSLKYSFHRMELKNWKGRISERLVEIYIRKTLTPNLKKEGVELIFWNSYRGHPYRHARFPLPLSDITIALLEGSKDIDWEKAYDELQEIVTLSGEIKNVKDLTKEERRICLEQWKNAKKEEATKIPKEIKLFFLENGFYPDSNLCNSTIRFFSLLEVPTDGILFKLKITGKKIKKEKAFLDLEYRLDYMPKEIPVVSGELEVIEIKSDNAFISRHQAEAYRKVIESGYNFRYFHVFIISFENNQFEITEKLVKNVTEFDRLIRTERRMI
jgi:hypothetical protein